MLRYPEEYETPEIRLMRTIVELNHRVLHTQSAEDRTALRATITVLRVELIKLIESMPIMSEDDVVRASSAQNMALMPMTLRTAS